MSHDLHRAIHIVIDGGVFLDPDLARRSVTTVHVDVASLSADLSARD